MTTEDKKAPTEIAEAQLDHVEGGGVVNPPWGIDRIDQNPSTVRPELLSRDASTRTNQANTDKKESSSYHEMSWDNVEN